MIHDSGFATILKVAKFLKGGFSDWYCLSERTKTHVNSRMRKEVAACNLSLHGEVNSAANVENLLSSTLDTN